jgi:hypothetical protein
MRKLIIFIVNEITRSISRLIGADKFQRLIGLFLEANDTGTYDTLCSRPQSAAQVTTINDSLIQKSKLAVILQGQIILEKDFTLETLKIYKSTFKDHILILSTWEGEDAATIDAARKMGVHCCINPKPKYFGVSNINLQIVSSGAGVRKAHELGAEYALKSRTDQRIYAPDVAEYLHNLLESFPVKGNFPKQKKRIVCVSMNTFKYRMYGLSDMTIYGHIDDMLLYWDISLDERVFPQEEKDRPNTLASFAKWRVCEVYLATEFLKRIDRKIEWTLADSWLAYVENFCVIDKEQLDLFWPKYGRAEYRWRSYQQNYRTQEMTFRDWFNIYRGLENRKIFEQLLEQ